jgi:hypothetical protein
MLSGLQYQTGWLRSWNPPSDWRTPSLTVYPTLDNLDTVLLATMQCENVQLRCVMQLSDPLVKAFLWDALQERVFTMLFSIENTRQCAVIGVPMEFDEPRALLDRLRNATRSTAGIAPAMQLTSTCCNPAFRESLIDGQQVNDVIAVLATVPTAQDFEMAAGRNSGEPNAHRDATLH